jgi:DNA methylase N-4/N-6 domain protein
MNNYENLQKVLKEIFEMDKADLDFGIYRIMNQKREQVMDFINNKLPKDIKDILAQTQSKDSVDIRAELDKAIKSAQDLGIDPDTLPKVIELKAQLENTIDTNALEQEVFSHLASFFKRYYKAGDFISLRRYKKDVYAIPYEGEEVKLHWANHDQYYIKTSEYLKNYAFKTKDGRLVHFQLKEASTEQNNNKTQGDQERRFAIYTEQPVEVVDGSLYINFTYEPHKKTVKQEDLEADAIKVIQDKVAGLAEDFSAIFDKAPTEKNKNRTIIEKHLGSFISRNSFDYFIHKDLGGFLSRELDFYIKNEVLYIDDINTENPAFFTAQLSKIKALKTVASKIITFLAQIEDFQKKLWLKKKFVISTNYCITLDRIPEEYYAEIAASQAQLKEWKELYDVSITSAEQLAGEPFLVLDTKHFSEEFKDKLLGEFDNLDEETNGLLIHSDNFHALNLMQEKYREKVKTIYIDPPYNTGNDGFTYKDGFQSSSWASFVQNRLMLAKYLLNQSGVIFQSIDDNEQANLKQISDNVFGEENFISTICHKARASISNDKIISSNHNFLLFHCNSFNHVFSNRELFGLKTDLSTYNKTDENGEKYKLTPVDGPGGAAKGNPYYEFKGVTGYWRYSLDKMNELYENGEIVVTANNLQRKTYLKNMLHKRQTITTWWENGFLTSNATRELETLFAYKNFSNPKNVNLIKQCIDISTQSSDLILDYFAGSGTTGHATIKLNREDGGSRKYILVEMGGYFDTVTKPRIQKVIYTDSWKDGKPQDREGISQLVKYQVLESYEDALNNLQLPDKPSESLLNFDEQAQEEYLLNYMLDVESREHLFNIQMFRNPFNYQLKVTENNELVPTKVDLVETFNYLIGLYVERMQRVGDIKFIEGKTREGAKTLVIWRNVETTTNEETAKKFRKIYDSIRSSEFDQIYINGDHHFDNMRTGEDTFKVKLIEETFFKQMFNISNL